VRSVLEDEEVTEQEWAAVIAQFEACVAEAGMQVTEYQESGEYGVEPNSVDLDVANGYLDDCEVTSGERWVSYLRRVMTVNPENADMDGLILACMLRQEALPVSYGVEDYRRDASNGELPYLDRATGPQVLGQCTVDPR
jgi:hypothetical protein